MKADEKACPQCAETIKKAAHLCKHCGHRFSQEEIAAGLKQEQKRSRNTGIGCLGVMAALLVLFVITVGNDPSDSQTADAGETGSETSDNPFADSGKQVAWIEASKDAVRKRLRDPDGAQFRNVHFYSGGPSAVACGEVNAKNGFGGYVGYERFIAAGNVDGLVYLASDMTSAAEMDDAWRKICVKSPTDTQ